VPASLCDSGETKVTAEPSETVGTRTEKKAATRQALVDAATRLFKAQGVEATTMDQIAHAAGTSRTSVFNYFPYKELILCEIGARYVDEVARAALSRPHADARSMLLALADAIADLATREPAVIAAVAREMSHPDPARRQCAMDLMHYPELVEQILNELDRQGGLRHPDRRDSVGRQMVDLTVGVLLRAGGDFPLSGVRNELQANVDLILEGAASPAVSG
jgi:AcrR family transcriptional regulator